MMTDDGSIISALSAAGETGSVISESDYTKEISLKSDCYYGPNDSICSRSCSPVDSPLVGGVGGEASTKAPSRHSGRSRNFCFTLNNYDDTVLAFLRGGFGVPDRVVYLCFQPEVGESGTKHLQGLVMFRNAMSRSAVAKLIPRAHIESMAGTAHQARDYCSKQSTRDESAGFPFFELGVLPAQRGTAGGSSLKDLTADVRAGLSDRDLCEKYPMHWLRYQRAIATTITLYASRRTDHHPVRWYYGPTDTGKSRSFYAEFGFGHDVYAKEGSNRWWCGMSHGSAVLVDDFRPGPSNFGSFPYLLRVCDRYPMRVETKGGSLELNPKCIVFTCPFHPKDAYHQRGEDIQQLLRRLTEIRYFPSDKYPTEESWREFCKKEREEAALSSSIKDHKNFVKNSY